MKSKQDETHDKVLHFYMQNRSMSQRSIAKTLSLPQSTVNRIILRFSKTGETKRKSGSSGSRKADPKLVLKVKRALTANPQLSLNDLCRKFSTTKSKIRTAKSKLQLKSYKVQKAPHRNDKQNATAKSRALKLYNEVLARSEGCIMQDDESNFKADFNQMNGHQFYSKRVGGSINNKFRYKYVDKFAKKFMMWQAICSCGLKSPSYVCMGTMKSPEYIKECLQKRLLPFYNKHAVKPIFWPDLATIHYSKDAIAWYKANKVTYVDKNHNPPNTPELRPIERYWAKLKAILIKTSSPALDVLSFKRKYTAAAIKVTQSAVQALMEGVKRKVRLFSRGEPVN